jgi:hypothetical protein
LINYSVCLLLGSSNLILFSIFISSVTALSLSSNVLPPASQFPSAYKVLPLLRYTLALLDSLCDHQRLFMGCKRDQIIQKSNNCIPYRRERRSLAVQ